MGISEFKTRCIRLPKKARRSMEPLVVTRRGQPLVRIEPLSGSATARRLGGLRAQAAIGGDLVWTDFENEWDLGD